MKRDQGVGLGLGVLDIPAGRCCKLCGRKRPFAEFVWTDAAGQSGVSPRCVACRTRGHQPHPDLPAQRYPVTRHAVQRFMERVRPDLLVLPRGDAVRLARHEMSRLMADAPWTSEWPEWLAGRAPHGAPDPPGYLLPTLDVVFVLAKRRRFGRTAAREGPKRGYTEPSRVVVTVLVRGWEGED